MTSSVLSTQIDNFIRSHEESQKPTSWFSKGIKEVAGTTKKTSSTVTHIFVPAPTNSVSQIGVGNTNSVTNHYHNNTPAPAKPTQKEKEEQNQKITAAIGLLFGFVSTILTNKFYGAIKKINREMEKLNVLKKNADCPQNIKTAVKCKIKALESHKFYAFGKLALSIATFAVGAFAAYAYLGDPILTRMAANGLIGTTFAWTFTLANEYFVSDEAFYNQETTNAIRQYEALEKNAPKSHLPARSSVPSLINKIPAQYHQIINDNYIQDVRDGQIYHKEGPLYFNGTQWMFIENLEQGPRPAWVPEASAPNLGD